MGHRWYQPLTTLGCGQSWVLVGLEQGHSLSSEGAGQRGSSLVLALGQVWGHQGQVATARPRGEALQGALSSVWVPCLGQEGYW